MTEIQIANMVCPRCIQTVEGIFNNLGIPFSDVSLGKVSVEQAPEPETLKELDDKLEAHGFSRLERSGQKLVAEVKSALIGYLFKLESGDELPLRSEYLSSRLYKNYSYISERFTSVEGRSIEQYWISLKTERAKELLEAGELSITTIAHRLGYSSSQYFANQFRKETGITPSEWRKSGNERTGLQSVG